MPDSLRMVAIGIMLYEQMLEAGSEEAVWDEDGEVMLDVDLDAVFLEEVLRIVSSYDFSDCFMTYEFYAEDDGDEEEGADADAE